MYWPFDRKEPKGKFRILEIEMGLLVDIFKALDGERRFKVEGVPEDAVVVGAYVTGDDSLGTVKVVIHSDTFDEVPTDRGLPYVRPTVTEVWAAPAGFKALRQKMQESPESKAAILNAVEEAGRGQA